MIELKISHHRERSMQSNMELYYLRQKYRKSIFEFRAGCLQLYDLAGFAGTR